MGGQGHVLAIKWSKTAVYRDVIAHYYFSLNVSVVLGRGTEHDP
jgi:uncharacterized protein with HEPN domain